MNAKQYIYTGIGSRRTPKEVLEVFADLAGILAENRYVLYSGGADGADNAFEMGCDNAGGEKQIFLPWKGFNGSDSQYIVHDNIAFQVAEKFHPYYQKLSPAAKKLMARNTHQIVGWDFKTRTDVVLCYTPKGAGNGGTGQAIRIAKYYNIPILDAGKYNDLEEYKKDVLKFCLQHD